MSQNLGLSSSSFQRGFVADDGRVQASVGGVFGQVLQGQGSSGDYSKEDWRVSLAAAEHRGCGSPRRVLSDGGQGDSGEPAGKQAGVHGISKGRRKNWIKKKLVRNYAVGEDLAWDNVLKMAKCSLVGRVMGCNFAKKTIQDWAAASWGKQFGYNPEIEMLNRGWFAINLKKEEDF